MEGIKVVEPDYVYTITGSISPTDIDEIITILLNEGIHDGVSCIMLFILGF